MAMSEDEKARRIADIPKCKIMRSPEGEPIMVNLTPAEQDFADTREYFLKHHGADIESDGRGGWTVVRDSNNLSF